MMPTTTMPIIKTISCHRKTWHTHMDIMESKSTTSPQSTEDDMDLESPFHSQLLSKDSEFSEKRERSSIRRPQNRPRGKWMKVLQIILVMFLFTGEWLAVGGSEDWTTQCPSKCKCTWVSGKKTADCKGSFWTSIPSGLSSDVQVLEMDGSTIKTLPQYAFEKAGLLNLQKVFLKNCRIETIDREAFAGLEIMIELDLSGNLISSLDMDSFNTTTRLRELKLSNNPLTMLTGLSFPSLGYLKLIDLSDCQLSSFPRNTFDKLLKLDILLLTGNRFTHLSEELFKHLTLKSLSLAGNPWNCDCRLKSLRDWVIDKNLFQHDTKCTEPAHVANFAWNILMSGDFACRPEIVSVQINGKPTDALLVHTDIGSDITLECLVRGNPPPELKWVRDGQVLTNTSRSYGKSYFLHMGEESLDLDNGGSIDFQGRWVNLTIPKTEQEDAGEYTCVGSNPGGVVEKNMTLNFQDVPSGAGVGHGLGGLGGGAYRDTGWIWILITVLALLILATSMVTLICFCSRRRRVKTTRAQDLKGEDQPQQRQLLLTPTSRSESSEKADEDGSTMLLLKEKYLVGPDARSKSADILSYDTEMDSYNRPSSAQMMQPPPPSTALTVGPHGANQSTEYPDLLDLPHTRFQESPAPSTVSTLPDSTRLLITPQQLNPAMLVSPQSRMGYPIYATTGRPTSPYGTHMPFSPSEPAVVPAGPQRGYVTLPRRPRVSSWDTRDPTSPQCPSPTGSAATISFPIVKAIPKYDNLGPRTTADGSSKLSLNNIGDGSTPNPTTPTSHYHTPHPPLMTGTLGRHGMLRSTPLPGVLGTPISHFAPIQEVEPVTTPSDPQEDDKPFGARSPSKGPETPPKPAAPKTDTYSSDGTPKHKKVPPKPNPKPPRKKAPDGTLNSNGGLDVTHSPQKSPDPIAAAILGDDGTEV